MYKLSSKSTGRFVDIINLIVGEIIKSHRAIKDGSKYAVSFPYIRGRIIFKQKTYSENFVIYSVSLATEKDSDGKYIEDPEVRVAHLKNYGEYLPYFFTKGVGRYRVSEIACTFNRRGYILKEVTKKEQREIKGFISSFLHELYNRMEING